MFGASLVQWLQRGEIDHAVRSAVQWISWWLIATMAMIRSEFTASTYNGKTSV